MPTFDLPDGFEVPPDSVGKEFTVVSKLKDNGDGTLTLLEIDGSPIAGYEEEEVTAHEKGESPRKEKAEEDMFSRMQAAGFGKTLGGQR